MDIGNTYFIHCIPNSAYTLFCFCSTTADVDYISLVQNITFDSGETSKVFSVAIRDDQIAESDETFEVFLKSLSNSPYDVRIDETSVAVGIIFDNEIPSKSLLAAYTWWTFVCNQIGLC